MTLKTLQAMLTHVMNICHNCERGVNGWTLGQLYVNNNPSAKKMHLASLWH